MKGEEEKGRELERRNTENERRRTKINKKAKNHDKLKKRTKGDREKHEKSEFFSSWT